MTGGERFRFCLYLVDSPTPEAWNLVLAGNMRKDANSTYLPTKLKFTSWPGLSPTYDTTFGSGLTTSCSSYQRKCFIKDLYLSWSLFSVSTQVERQKNSSLNFTSTTEIDSHYLATDINLQNRGVENNPLSYRDIFLSISPALWTGDKLKYYWQSVRL